MKKRAFVYLLLASFSATLLSCEDVDLGVGAAFKANLTETPLNIKSIDGSWQLASVEVKVDANTYTVGVGEVISSSYSLTGQPLDIRESLGTSLKFFDDSVANYLPNQKDPVKGKWQYDEKQNEIVLFKESAMKANYLLNKLSTSELQFATEIIDNKDLTKDFSKMTSEQQLVVTLGLPIVFNKINDLTALNPNAKIQMVLKYKR